ncbi:MAG: hypothetical protein BRD35_08895 [Bacteroidetes bacterium QH_7_62_13]|nr:MAG: hypothetical protein BRD35_08895 [Bacteroidetes bacterium QH_7_62_13]
MPCFVRRVPLLFAVVGLLSGPTALAQSGSVQQIEDCDPWFALPLTVHDVGVGIGDTEHTIGGRVNFGDRCLQSVSGVNATLFPSFSPTGTVNGLALGLPMTGSARLRGLGVGLGLFFGNAGDVRGAVDGLLVGGLATVSESPVRGMAIGSVGAGVGAPATGVLLAGGTAVTTDRGRGLILGGAVAGTGGPSIALLAGGLVAGTTDRLYGAAVSPGLVGAGGRLVGLGVGGLAAGSRDAVQGLMVGGAALRAQRLTGLGVTAGYAYVSDGPLQGGSIAAVNHINGTQRGLTIGLFNYARELHGVQVGLINVARNNSFWRRILPGLNFSF